MAQYVVRITVLERHTDGSSRLFTSTGTFDAGTTLRELYQWREKKVHDPVNGEFASREIIITPDDSQQDWS
ncbi:MAG: hypothetical protein WCK47_14600 [bacterium]|nr:hypothetical protein [Candidatus Sumerlaeota bacterium]